MSGKSTLLLTGATGYIGGRLLPRLEARGARVRCLVRRPGLFGRPAGDATRVVPGDVVEGTGLEEALDGVDAAFYLVHSMGTSGDFQEDDRRAASKFAEAAARAGVRRIIYLGGLGRGRGLSPHLASRHEVGEILRSSGAQVIEFRASIVIGSGSLSFDMVRALVERLPVMVTPSWVRVRAQPIAVEDLLAYLEAALDLPLGPSRIYEVGGSDVVSYEQLMREYARQRGLRRWMLPVPFLTPRLSSLWLGLVTPVYARIGRRLFTSLRHETVVEDRSALADFSVRPAGVAQAIARAMANEDRAYAESRWTDALSSKGRLQRFPEGGRRFADSRSSHIDAPPRTVFEVVGAIGGSSGWYAAQPLWRVRGALDRLAGGVGMRGRPAGRRLRVGDALDFWRVERLVPGRHLRLTAEMRLPGRGWLDFELRPEKGGTRLVETLLFEPLGLAGLAYWYAMKPFHDRILRGMSEEIARRSAP